MAKKLKVFILVSGNPIDGYTFIGPFAGLLNSIEYGERLSDDWWTADLQEPEP